MTTIAYKDGVMACDSRWTHDGLITVSAIKIKRLAGGALLGSAGANDGRTFERLLDKVAHPDMLPTFEEVSEIRNDFCGILVLPTRDVFVVSATMQDPTTDGFEDDIGIWPVPGRVAAVGSGKECALAVMVFGGSAADGVAVACKLDPNSGLPVHEVYLKEPPKKEDERGDSK